MVEDNIIWKYTFTVMQIMIAAVIMFGNVLTFIVVARFQYLRTITNKFVFSLAISDTMVAVTILLNVIDFHLDQKVACISIIVVGLMAIMLTISSLVEISVDR